MLWRAGSPQKGFLGLIKTAWVVLIASRHLLDCLLSGLESLFKTTSCWGLCKALRGLHKSLWNRCQEKKLLPLPIESFIYRKSSIRSRPCINLDPNFPRLVLEVFQKVSILQQTFFRGHKEAPKEPKNALKSKFYWYTLREIQKIYHPRSKSWLIFINPIFWFVGILIF